jgi:hypothetical protein
VRKEIQQDLQEDSRAGDQKANSHVFNWAVESDCLDIVEGLAPSEMKEETSKAQPLEWKMIVVHLDQLASYQGTARNKWP